MSYCSNELSFYRFTTGKIEKEYSSHATAMKFIQGIEAVGLKDTILLEKFDFCIYEICGNFLKNLYFANNFFIKVRITEIYFTHVSLIIVNIIRTANFVSIKMTSLQNFAFFFQRKISERYLKIGFSRKCFQNEQTPIAFFSFTNYKMLTLFIPVKLCRFFMLENL